jgi:DNA-binding MarR family transcriptional regulator
MVKSLYHMRTNRQSSSPRRFSGDPNPDDPLIGARLRFCLTEVEQRLGEALASAGFADIQIAHFKVLRFPPPENERPIDLAQRAGMSRQAMNYLLLQLEEMGYVQRVAVGESPARLVSLTEKGWKAAEIQRATVHQIEREWERRIGVQRFQTFYAVLKELSGG